MAACLRRLPFKTRANWKHLLLGCKWVSLRGGHLGISESKVFVKTWKPKAYSDMAQRKLPLQTPRSFCWKRFDVLSDDLASYDSPICWMVTRPCGLAHSFFVRGERSSGRFEEQPKCASEVQCHDLTVKERDWEAVSHPRLSGELSKTHQILQRVQHMFGSYLTFWCSCSPYILVPLQNIVWSWSLWCFSLVDGKAPWSLPPGASHPDGQ